MWKYKYVNMQPQIPWIEKESQVETFTAKSFVEFKPLETKSNSQMQRQHNGKAKFMTR